MLNVLYFDTLSSTNDKATDLLSKGCSEGTVAAARSQTAGRGQQNAVWESEAGENLTFSIALRPTFLHAEHIFYLSKVVSLGVVDFLLSQKINALIKWPNDIYVGERKICGILIEQSIKGEYVAQSVAGVGLNVNQRTFKHAPNATSMLLCSGAERELDDMLNSLSVCILSRYNALKEACQKNDSSLTLQGIDKEYHSLLYRRQVFFTYKCGNEHFTAKILSVEPSGELVLQKESGEVRRWGFKEVEFG